MPRAPQSAGLFTPGALTTLDPASGLRCCREGIGIQANTLTGWPTSNKAIYVPVVLNRWLTFSQMGWENGASVSGHVDVGVYDRSLAKIVAAGSTVQAGTSAFQAVTVTTTTLAPDIYWLAMVLDNTTGTVRNAAVLGRHLRTMGVQQMSAAFPLPSTLTQANPGSNYLPLITVGFETVL